VHRGEEAVKRKMVTMMKRKARMKMKKVKV
jgi:hypothetical protein